MARCRDPLPLRALKREPRPVPFTTISHQLHCHMQIRRLHREQRLTHDIARARSREGAFEFIERHNNLHGRIIGGEDRRRNQLITYRRDFGVSRLCL